MANLITVGVGKDFSNITAARAAVPTVWTEDQIIRVFSGTFTEGVNQPADTTNNFRLTYEVAVSEDVVWQSGVTNGIAFGPCDNVSIVRFYILSDGGGRIFFPQGDNWIMDGNVKSAIQDANIYCQVDGTSGHIIKNNTILNCGGGLGTGDTLRIADCQNVKILHNVFSQISNFNRQSVHLFGSLTSGIEIKRNIFYPFPVAASNVAIQLDAGTGITGFDSDENTFVSTPRTNGQIADIGTWLGVNAVTLADWQLASGQDANSEVVNAFPGAASIRPEHTITGVSVGVDFDLNGEIREEFNSGPLEFLPAFVPPVGGIDPSILTIVVDNPDGVSVDITYVPPVDAAYSLTQVRFKRREEKAWTDGVTDVGVQGSPSDVNQPGLTLHTLYDFQIHAVDTGGNVSVGSGIDSRVTDDNTFVSEEETLVSNLQIFLATMPSFQDLVGATGDSAARIAFSLTKIFKVAELDPARPFARISLDDTVGGERIAEGTFLESGNLLLEIQTDTSGDEPAAFDAFANTVGQIRKELQRFQGSDQFFSIRNISFLVNPRRASRSENEDVYAVVYIIETGI